MSSPRIVAASSFALVVILSWSTPASASAMLCWLLGVGCPASAGATSAIMPVKPVEAATLKPKVPLKSAEELQRPKTKPISAKKNPGANLEPL